MDSLNSPDFPVEEASFNFFETILPQLPINVTFFTVGALWLH